MPIKKCYLLPSLLLKLWVKENWNKLHFFQRIEAKNEDYITTSYAIPIPTLLEGLKTIIKNEL